MEENSENQFSMHDIENNLQMRFSLKLWITETKDAIQTESIPKKVCKYPY